MDEICNQRISKDDFVKCQDVEKCPVPSSHNRLEEVHRLWHQAAHAYRDPVGFRTNLNACIQALRSVTFVLQKQKSNIPNFEPWYSIWQQKLKADPILNWLVQARNIIVKEGDLETKSIARASVLKSYNDPPYRDFLVPPLTPTLEIADQLAKELPEIVQRDAILKVERLWIANSLPEHELLEALAHAYGVLSILINDAHIQAGLPGTQIYLETESGKYELYENNTEYLRGRLPCMVASAEKRTVWIKLSTKEFVRPAIIPIAIADIEEVKERYGNIFETSLEKRKRSQNLRELADLFWKCAKHILSIDGHHIGLVIFILPNWRISLMELRPKDRSEKYVIWQSVANEIKRNGAQAICAISEVWVGPPESQFPTLPPTENPDRKEGLELSALSATGEEFSYFCYFERVNGSIIYKETQIIEEKYAFYLEPIREVWGISEKPKIIINKFSIGRNDPCPCKSGKKYKNCCASSFDKNNLEEGLCLFEKGSFVEAEKAFRNHLTQYIIWHNEHTVPFLLHDPLNAEELLVLDIDAVTELINFIANCIYYQNRKQDIDNYLKIADGIIDDKRYKLNIDSLREYWQTNIKEDSLK